MGLSSLLASAQRRAVSVRHIPFRLLCLFTKLSRFAAGKPSALVIDVGASSTSVTPVHDGLILRKGVSRTPLAGDFISQQLRLLFSASNPPIPLTPHYLVTSKTPVDAGAPAAATYRTFPPGAAPSPSFRRFEEERLLLEFKESVVQVWQGPGRLSAQAGGNSNSNGGAATPAPPSAPGGLDDTLRTAPRPFEMPDGFNQVFTADRYRAVEALFDPKAALVAPDAGSAPPPASQALLAVIQHALAQVDVDVRPLLLGNVVVVGATSLTQGFTERLNQELMGAYPGPRVRIQAPGNLYERRFASWIGGSILASLGTFHQVGSFCFLLLALCSKLGFRSPSLYGFPHICRGSPRRLDDSCFRRVTNLKTLSNRANPHRFSIDVDFEKGIR